MILDTYFNLLMDRLLNQPSKRIISVEQLIHSMDLTLLDKNASATSLFQLNQDAKKHGVAAVCVYIEHLKEFSFSKAINLATVINFPEGMDDLNASLTSIEKAVQLGATEIDYVLPYPLYFKGQKQKALSQCDIVMQLCKQHNLTLKIILETEVFPNAETIYFLCNDLIALGCNFIKTSTGRLPLGASLYAVFAILSAIKESHSSCGIKISGGVKKPEQAFNYAMLAELILEKPINKSWFRIGASSLLGKLLNLETA